MTSTQEKNAELVDLLKTDFVHRLDTSHAWSRAVSMLMTLPCLRSLYIGNAHKIIKGTNKDEVIDTTLGINMTSGANYPKFGYQSYIPFMTFNASNNEYLVASDDENHHILGSEVDYIENPGLTIGCWLRPHSLPTDIGIPPILHRKPFGRWSTGVRGYALLQDISTTNRLGFATNDTSNTINVVDHTEDTVVNTWYFLAGIWDPNVSMSVIVNGIKTDFAGTPASLLHDGSMGLSLGGSGIGSSLAMFDGDICFAFLCASALHPSAIMSLFQHMAPMFGVRVVESSGL